MSLTIDSTVYSPSQPDLTPVSDTTAFHNKNCAEWQRLITEKLVEWGADPHYFEDDDIDAPQPEIIALALRVAQQLRDGEQAPPHRIVPDGDGGIVFERRAGTILQKCHFWDDGSVHVIVMNDSTVVDRMVVQ